MRRPVARCPARVRPPVRRRHRLRWRAPGSQGITVRALAWIDRGRPGAAFATAQWVDANDKPALGVDGFAGADHPFPPSPARGCAWEAACASGDIPVRIKMALSPAALSVPRFRMPCAHPTGAPPRLIGNGEGRSTQRVPGGMNSAMAIRRKLSDGPSSSLLVLPVMPKRHTVMRVVRGSRSPSPPRPWPASARAVVCFAGHRLAAWPRQWPIAAPTVPLRSFAASRWAWGCRRR